MSLFDDATMPDEDVVKDGPHGETNGSNPTFISSKQLHESSPY